MLPHVDCGFLVAFTALHRSPPSFSERLMCASRYDGNEANFIIFMKDFIIREELAISCRQDGFWLDVQSHECRPDCHTRSHFIFLIS